MPRHLHTDPDEHISDAEHEDLIDDIVNDIKEHLNTIIHDEDLETLRKVRNFLRDPEVSCEDMSPELRKVLEGYRPIPMRTRMFYPRGFRLSESFIDAFHAEYDRLMGEGLNPKNLLDRFGKALKFHVNETRRYKAPVVEGGRPEWKDGDDPEAPMRSDATPEERKRQMTAYRKHQKSGAPPWSKTKDKKGGSDSGIKQS